MCCTDYYICNFIYLIFQIKYVYHSTMGKKNSKLSQETVNMLITETYCKYTTTHSNETIV